MLLKKLLEAVSLEYKENEIDIKAVSFNSKEVIPGTLFICKGSLFKTEYLKEAITKGAVAYISEISYPEIKKEYENIKEFIVEDVREAMARIAKVFYEIPWDELKIIGITGTKGKSTTAYFMKFILDEWLGKETGIVSSIETFNGMEKFDSHITTPEVLELFRHLRIARDSGIDYFTLEISSQALKYNRVDGINLDVAIFLNISEDHISPVEHIDFEDYFSSKLKIFSQAKSAVINMSSDYADRIYSEAIKTGRVITFSADENIKADFSALDLKKIEEEIHFTLSSGTKYDGEYIISIPGFFNVENALAAIATSFLLDIPQECVKIGLRNAKSSGRMEVFSTCDKEIIAIVDYAHNKLSFQKLFSSMKSEYPDYSIKAVFGSAGGKAYNRRKELGQIAGQYSDKIYLTEEDPNFESIIDICKDIAKYVKSPYEIIEDREEAIKKAFTEAEGKTLILVIGKGEESTQKISGKLVPYPPDGKIVSDLIKKFNR